MVKKLIKYDFLSYMRKLLPMEVILLGVAFLTRFVLIFEDRSSPAYNIVFNSSIIAYGITVMVCLIWAYASVISRFYRNLFSEEGYLTFTLPITSMQHLESKLISGVCVIFITVFNVILSFCIVMSGDPIIEIFKAMNYLGIKAVDYLGADFWFYALEILLYAVVSTAASILLFYACTCIGQLARKNKVRTAFLVYFAQYFVRQIVQTFLIVILSTTGFYWELINLFVENIREGVHFLAWISILFTVILSTIYYLICAHVMDKRVNLE